MPNNTDVRIYLDHKDKKRIDDMQMIFDNERPFDQIIPMPKDIDRGPILMGKEPENNWYDWACENWGTKWDAYQFKVQRLGDTSLYVTLETAWSPPIPIFKRLIELGFDVSAYYLDEGWNFIGQFECGEAFDFAVNTETPYNLIDEFNLESKIRGSE